MAGPPEDTRVWTLVGIVHPPDRITMIEIRPLPFRVGRRPSLHLTLPSASVSTEHAEFYADDSGLRLRDLGSTNGTFVNRSRIEDVPIQEGDVVHFADLQFEVMASPAPAQSRTAVFKGLPSPQSLLGVTRYLRELLAGRSVTVLFQPIVDLPGRMVVGHEALGRGAHPGLPESPADLFRAAAALGVEADLSRLFRQKVVEVVAERPRLPSVFVNTHPAELAQPGFVESLLELPRGAPRTQFTVEIHEAAIVKVADMVELKAALRQSGISLAYDDFGAGQARLLELGEAPPDLLKFDLRFIRGVDSAPTSKRRLLKSLVGIVRDLGAEPVAEGVETAEESEACVEAGFTRAQGYFFGAPGPPPGE